MIILILLILQVIPEPGILYYGQVRDNGCQLSQKPSIEWHLQVPEDETNITVRSTLQILDEGNGLYLYRVNVPLATEIPGIPVREGAILVTETPKKVIRTWRIPNTSISKTDTIWVSSADRGTYRMWSFVL